MDNVIILIPSLDPDGELSKYVDGLLNAGIPSNRILVVNDGSTLNVDVFDALRERGITVLSHAVNQGKGRALKTGINYILNTFSEDEIKGVVTADADGQHSVEDTIQVAKHMAMTGNVTFGTRNLRAENVPFKSRWGNRITTNVFKFLYGRRVNDTQTGLRGLPFDFLKECLSMPGERFDFEIVMLMRIVERNRALDEVLIDTIYIDSNRATHFHPVKDAWRIYKVLLSRGMKYVLASIAGFVVDISLFHLISKALLVSPLTASMAILIATVAARIVSCTVNFSLNKNSVFKSEKGFLECGWKYALLAICQLTASWLLVTFLFSRLTFGATLIKLLVDAFLFLISYQIQHRWVFK